MNGFFFIFVPVFTLVLKINFHKNMLTDVLLSNPYLIQADDLTHDDIYKIFDKADFFLSNFSLGKKFDDLKGIVVALAFFEPSTRTKLSFELAAKRLSADVISFQSSGSSLTKGESLLDTLKTIEAMDVNIFIIRHAFSGSPFFLQENTNGIVINAGDGKHEHPTQALLDSYTLYRQFGKIKDLKITIIGDILHSRVARSNITVMKTLGAEVALCSPGTLLPRHLNVWNAKIIESLDEVIEWSDVIMVLRLQRERMDSGLLPSTREYSKYYGITLEHISRKPNLVLMHPGPVNYGIELDYKLSSYPNVLIQTQVRHGVFIRMAVLSLLAMNIGKA
jgi:aspartate carbamoyltransferase catalytic subunit